MKRTAADFARDATLDVWTFTTSTGQDLTPRPRSFFTYGEQLEVARNDVRWAEIMSAAAEIPDDLESSLLLMLKLRFTPPGVYVAALEESRRTGEPMAVDLADFEAFWGDAEQMPLGETNVDPAHRIGLHGLLAELDGFYRSPIPGSDQEQADADADPAGAAAGKSPTAGS